MLPMETLRSLCEGIGLEGVRTYIQSGNVLFRASAKDLAKAGAALEAAIETERGFRPSVVVRGLAGLRAAMEANPFASRRGLDDKRLLVMFLAGTPGASARKALGALPAAPEEVELLKTEAYLYFPNGLARPKLNMAAVERAIGVPGTCRNWRTVGTLLKMGEELAS